MRNAVLAVLAAVVGIAACADAGDPLRDPLTGPSFTHIVNGCREGDVPVSWTPFTPPDDNGNGIVCQRTSGPRKSTSPTYYDDLDAHLKGPPKK